MTRRSALDCMLLLAALAPLRAQTRDSTLVRVHDTRSAPIAGADVTLRRAGVVIAHSLTNADGLASIPFATDYTLVDVLIRRIGFQPYRRDMMLPDTGTVLDVALPDAPYLLDTVNARSTQSLRERRYHLGAADIEQNKRSVYESWDLLRTLRPDIAYGREPDPMYSPCNPPGVQDVWVNGVWIAPEFVVVNDVVVDREPHGSAATPHIRRAPLTWRRQAVMSAIASIKPEDIDELTFRDCLDTPIASDHARNAVFIVLKPGVAFDPERGSYKPPRQQ